MLVGDVPRYRFPVDPLMYVMASGGVFGLANVVVKLSRRTGSGATVAPSPLRRGEAAPTSPLQAGEGVR
jgi:hypothetical protein